MIDTAKAWRAFWTEAALAFGLFVFAAGVILLGGSFSACGPLQAGGRCIITTPGYAPAPEPDVSLAERQAVLDGLR
jgi:hypothetical protein